MQERCSPFQFMAAKETKYYGNIKKQSKMALYRKMALLIYRKMALFENKNNFLFLYFICLLFKLQMCQINLPDPVLDIGFGKYRQKFNINFLAQKFGEKYCSILAGIYVFTGEDVTSAFKRKGKLDPLKKLNRPHHQEVFRYKTKS